jgi:hypothetical protein
MRSVRKSFFGEGLVRDTSSFWLDCNQTQQGGCPDEGHVPADFHDDQFPSKSMRVTKLSKMVYIYPRFGRRVSLIFMELLWGISNYSIGVNKPYLRGDLKMGFWVYNRTVTKLGMVFRLHLNFDESWQGDV